MTAKLSSLKQHTCIIAVSVARESWYDSAGIPLFQGLLKAVLKALTSLTVSLEGGEPSTSTLSLEGVGLSSDGSEPEATPSSLPCGSLLLHHHSQHGKKVRERDSKREDESKMEITVLYHLISKVTSHHCCHNPFVGSKSLG